MSWEGHVARMLEMRNVYNILFGKFEWKDQGIDGKITLEYVLGK
jgi:hypothetical protein